MAESIDASSLYSGAPLFSYIELVSGYKENRIYVIILVAILFSAARCASLCKLRRLRANEAVKTIEIKIYIYGKNQ